MNVDVSAIVAAKLEQMAESGAIQKKIEESLEKSIMSAITSEIDSYRFTAELREQMEKAIHGVAAQSGLAAYNGFISSKVRQIVQEICADDLTAKLQNALDRVLLKKYENVKLSDIFKRYHEWVCEHTDESDKYDLQYYTADLEVNEDGSWTRYDARFAERPDANKPHSWDPDEHPDIEIHFSTYHSDKSTVIGTLRLGRELIDSKLRIGYLSEFEAFLVNLYYNKTEVLMDMEDADDYGFFDIDI